MLQQYLVHSKIIHHKQDRQSVDNYILAQQQVEKTTEDDCINYSPTLARCNIKFLCRFICFCKKSLPLQRDMNFLIHLGTKNEKFENLDLHVL